jgi:hypothetical protein
MRRWAVLGLVALLVGAPAAAQSPGAGQPAASSPGSLSPVDEPVIVPGYRFVTHADPAFALLIPEDWVVDDVPQEGRTWSAHAPDATDGAVTVTFRTSGAAVKGRKAWRDARTKAIRKLSDIGAKILFSGDLDFLPAGPVANVEWALAQYIVGHDDEYRYGLSEDAAMILTLSWFHSGWDPAWFTIRDSFNPGAATLPVAYDATATVDPSISESLDPACADATQGLYDALFEIDSRLDVGMVIGDYRERVGDAQVAYDRTGIDDLAQACKLLVGDPLRRVLNEYIAAQGRWSDCISDLGCRTSSIETSLQTRWSRASSIMDDLSETYFG